MSRTDNSGSGGHLTEQEAYDLLSSRRRRLAIAHLRECGRAATLGELARAVAALENDVPAEEVTRRQRRRAYTALRQSHLPRMAEAGVVEYDPDRGDIELTPAADELRRYAGDGRADADWRVLYVLIGGLAVIGLLASLANLPPFAALPWLAWAFALVVGVSTLAVAQFATRGAVTGLIGRRQGN